MSDKKNIWEEILGSKQSPVEVYKKLENEVNSYLTATGLQPIVEAAKPTVWDELVKEAKDRNSPNTAYTKETLAEARSPKISEPSPYYEIKFNTHDLKTSEITFAEVATVKPEINYLFNEAKYLEDAKAHIDKTYSGHYSGQYQATSIIIDAGHGTGFNIGNIIKYAKRYGKKDGYNKADLMKIIHYAVMQMHVHDLENLS